MRANVFCVIPDIASLFYIIFSYHRMNRMNRTAAYVLSCQRIARTSRILVSFVSFDDHLMTRITRILVSLFDDVLLLQRISRILRIIRFVRFIR